LPVGEVVAYPVPAVGSWFVVKVEERRRQPTPSFAAARDRLHHALLQEAATRLMQGAADGMKVRQFDLLGRDTAAYTRPAR